MLSIGRREPRWAAGAICLVLGASAFAQGAGDGASTGLLLAAVAPLPVETVMPIPDAGQYVFHYEMQYSSYQAATEGLKPGDFYAAPVAATGRAAALAPDLLHLQMQTLPEAQSSGRFNSIAPNVDLVDMFQLMDDGTGTAAHPPRRLAMLIDDWRVSASAHFPMLGHEHDTGATVSVQHKF